MLLLTLRNTDSFLSGWPLHKWLEFDWSGHWNRANER
jgi:hypothetical protein